MQLESGNKFKTSTAMGRQQQKKISQLLQRLLDSTDSVEFRNPVDWQAFGLVDYPAIVKKPMDLNTVKRNLNNGNYGEVEGCLADIQLIWDNCKLYNSKETWIWKISDKLEKNFKKMIKNYLPFVVVQGTAQQKKALKKQKEQPSKDVKSKSIKIPKQEPKDFQAQQKDKQDMQPQIKEDPGIAKRRQFIWFIPLCTPDQLGILFTLIQRNCPDAMQIDDKGDGQVNIHAQKIDDQLLTRLMDQLDMWGIGYQTVTTNSKKK